MSAKPRVADLYSCAGGAGVGYARVGFEVEGVDIKKQKRYPFVHHVQDAIEFIKEHGHRFDAFHASPPCQAYTKARTIMNNDHPDLLAPTREALKATGKPYIIENVVGAPMERPVMLCGSMFPELAVYRHRLFEASFELITPSHPVHIAPQNIMGRRPKPGEFMYVVGNFIGVEEAKVAMDIDWMVRNELREAIPPAYTEYLGKQLLEVMC